MAAETEQERADRRARNLAWARRSAAEAPPFSEGLREQLGVLLMPVLPQPKPHRRAAA